jgi:transposase InsO family protein
MRPGWSAALRMSASRLPHQRLLEVDTRMREAAARPVIIPEQVVIDHGKVFVSDTFTRACERLGISIQPRSRRSRSTHFARTWVPSSRTEPTEWERTATSRPGSDNPSLIPQDAT